MLDNYSKGVLMPKRKGTRVDEYGMKKCCTCGQLKTRTDFGYLRTTYDQLNCACKECERRRSILQKTGCTQEYFSILYTRQNGKCAICNIVLDGSTKIRKPHVDHRHSDGLIRGLLCGNCNWGIGHSFDNIHTLLNTIQYLYPIEYYI